MSEMIRRDFRKPLALYLPLFLAFLLFFSPSMGATVGKNELEQDKNQPISVTSDRMVSSQKENKIFFFGNVVAVRGDLTIRSEELEVYNGKEGKGTEKITARGKVVIDSKTRHATGEEAVYYDLTQRIILTGNPKAWEDSNEITGDEMIFLIEEDKFIVKGGEDKGRQINLIFHPKEKE